MDISPCSTPTEESMFSPGVTNISAVNTVSSTLKNMAVNVDSGGHVKYKSVHAPPETSTPISRSASASPWGGERANGLNISHSQNNSASPYPDRIFSRTGSHTSPWLEKCSTTSSRSGDASPRLERPDPAASRSRRSVGNGRSGHSSYGVLKPEAVASNSVVLTVNSTTGSAAAAINQTADKTIGAANQVVRSAVAVTNQAAESAATATNQTVINAITTLQKAYALVCLTDFPFPFLVD